MRSHVDTGRIIIAGESTEIKEQDYRIEFTYEGEPHGIAAIEGLPAGITRGLEIKSFMVDGVDITTLHHLGTKDYLGLDMKGNPYVENRLIHETNMVFNGVIVCDMDEDRISWFPYYHSDREIDFVFANNLATCPNRDGCYHGEALPHRDQWLNVPHRGLDTGNPRVGLGCSFTYGTGVNDDQTWPNLLGFQNLGVPGVGVDAIYHILESVRQQQEVTHAMILIPHLHRRLMTFQRKGQTFRVPVLPAEDEHLTQNYLWATAEELGAMRDRTMHEIAKDGDGLYSRGYLEKLANMPFRVSVSSWVPEVHEILKDHFDDVLPLFERIDDANDTPPHMGPESHRKWAESVMIQQVDVFGKDAKINKKRS